MKLFKFNLFLIVLLGMLAAVAIIILIVYNTNSDVYVRDSSKGIFVVQYNNVKVGKAYELKVSLIETSEENGKQIARIDNVKVEEIFVIIPEHRSGEFNFENSLLALIAKEKFAGKELSLKMTLTRLR